MLDKLQSSLPNTPFLATNSTFGLIRHAIPPIRIGFPINFLFCSQKISKIITINGPKNSPKAYAKKVSAFT